jgi:hypothetical protein
MSTVLSHSFVPLTLILFYFLVTQSLLTLFFPFIPPFYMFLAETFPLLCFALNTYFSSSSILFLHYSTLCFFHFALSSMFLTLSILILSFPFRTIFIHWKLSQPSGLLYKKFTSPLFQLYFLHSVLSYIFATVSFLPFFYPFIPLWIPCYLQNPFI